VTHTKAFADFLQLRAAGREETAHQSIPAKLLDLNLPALGATAQPLEYPGQLRRDRWLFLAKEAAGVVDQLEAKRRGEKTCNANLAPSGRTVCRRRSNTCISTQLRSSDACALHVPSTTLKTFRRADSILAGFAVSTDFQSLDLSSATYSPHVAEMRDSSTPLRAFF
jgi:hypothetical protein